MSKVQNPFIGRCSGSAGSMTFATQLKKNTMRSKIFNKVNDPSQNQINKRLYFNQQIAFSKQFYNLADGFGLKKASKKMNMTFNNYLNSYFMSNKEDDGGVFNWLPVGTYFGIEEISMLNDIVFSQFNNQSFTIEWNNNKMNDKSKMMDSVNMILCRYYTKEVTQFLDFKLRSDLNFTHYVANPTFNGDYYYVFIQLKSHIHQLNSIFLCVGMAFISTQ